MNTKEALLFLVCLLVAPLWAQPTPEKETEVDYSVFSLEELFRVDVITASKQKEPLWDAPGVVSVLTRKEIEKFGANNLWELLDRLPAVQKNFSSGVISSSIRGGEGLSQAHILMLIDGRPLRSSNGNISIYNSYLTFPLSMIDRIELVRGPGSTLYGTNAFEGVINIITLNSKRDTYINAQVKGGSFETKSVDFYAHIKRNDFSLDLGTHYLDTDGWEFDSNIPGATGKLNKKVFEDNKGIQLNIHYKNLSISSFQGLSKHFSEVFYSPTDDFSWHSDVKLINVAYNTQINDRYRLEIHATRNEEKFEFLQGEELALPTRAKDSLVEATFFGKPSDKLNFLIGGVYQYWHGYTLQGLYSAASDFPKERHSSAYAQLTYRPNRFTKLIAGAQLNKPEKASSDIVPRVGGIFNFSPRIGAKILYGEAFRSPIPQDRSIDISGFQLGNKHLRSETITTSSFQLFYQGEVQQHTVTLFRSTEKDLIRAVPPTPGDPDFQDRPDYINYALVNKNVGKLKFKGLEIESKLLPSERWFISGAFSYQENENQDGVKNTTLAPSFLIKLGAGYSTDQFSASIFDSHYDEFKDNRIINSSAVQLNEPSQPFDIVNMNIIYHIPVKGYDLSAELLATNLLDDDARIHQLPNDAFNTIPSEPGTAFYGSIRFRY